MSGFSSRLNQGQRSTLPGILPRLRLWLHKLSSDLPPVWRLWKGDVSSVGTPWMGLNKDWNNLNQSGRKTEEFINSRNETLQA